VACGTFSAKSFSLGFGEPMVYNTERPQLEREFPTLGSTPGRLATQAVVDCGLRHPTGWTTRDIAAQITTRAANPLGRRLLRRSCDGQEWNAS